MLDDGTVFFSKLGTCMHLILIAYTLELWLFLSVCCYCPFELCLWYL